MMLIIENPELLLALKSLYEFESPRVSGPHGGTPGFKPWSIEEVIRETEIEKNVLEQLVELLTERKQIMRIPAYANHPERFLTRTAEMVRTLGAMHEYVKRQTDEELDEEQHLQIIEATKWVPALLERPDREISIDELLINLREDLEDLRIRTVRTLSISQLLSLVALALTAIARETLSSHAIESFRLTRFQDRAIRKALMASFSPGASEEAMIVCAGTGSGKTIAFTVPVLVDSVLDTLENTPDSGARWSQLMIYPRNDLAFDQFSTLREYCGQLNLLLRDSSDFSNIYLTIALDADGHIKKEIERIPHPKGTQVGQWDLRWKNPKKPNVVSASASRYGGVHPNKREEAYRPANIVVASSESFRRRLMIPEVSRAVQTSLQRVVLDEIHLAEGLSGGHLRGLFNRLKTIAGRRNLLFIGASATIAAPERHVESVWGTSSESVDLIEPSSSESQGAPGGIANHVLVRPRSGVTKGGPIYNSTTLVGHQSKEQSWFEDRENAAESPDELEKMICFADSRDFVARWQMLLNENETNAHFQRIRPLQITGSGKGGAIRLPYAFWFDRPLAQQLNDTSVCDACRRCEKLPENIPVLKSQVQKFRTKVGGRSEPEKFVMEALREMGEELSINTLDECPHMQAGTCWHFGPGFGETPLMMDTSPADLLPHLTDRPGDASGKVFKNTLRSRRHTADSRGAGDDGLSDKDFTADALYMHQSGEAYPASRPNAPPGPEIPHDTIVATPTLEVGVDMKKVTNIMTHRAMRNVASYRQKAGRAGREKNSVTNTVTVLSKRPGDYQMYRNEQKLILDQLKEPVPVANKNRMVMKSQAYMSVMDWISVQGLNIEEIQNTTPDWRGQITESLELLQRRRDEIYAWLDRGFRSGIDSVLSAADMYQAIDTFRSHIELLLHGEYELDDGAERRSIIDELFVAIGDIENRSTRIKKPKEKESGIEGLLDDLVTATRDCTTFLSDEDIDSLSTLQHLVQDNELEDSESIASIIEGLEDQVPSLWRVQKRQLRNLTNVLKEMEEALGEEEIYSPDKAQRLAIDLYGLTNRTARYYFSWMLSECSVFLEDAPFCFIERVFENPHDRPIPVNVGEERKLKQSMSQFMRDLLPGSWNHRLSKSGTGHALKSPIGGHGAELDTQTGIRMANVVYRYIDGNIPGIDGFPLRVEPPGADSFDTNSVPEVIRMNHSGSNLPILRPKYVSLQTEYGVSSGENDDARNVPTKVWFSATSGLVARMDREKAESDRQGMIPETWPCRWATSRLVDPRDVLAFSPSERKSIPGQAGRHNVSSHPLMARLFDDISFSDKTEIKDVVLGIHRTQGVSMRYRLDGSRDAVFGQQFSTHGIKHTLSQSLLQNIEETSNRWKNRAFDTDFWKVLEHHFERIGFSSESERFAMRDLVKMMLLNLHKSSPSELPETVGEVVEQLQNSTISQEMFEQYMESIRLNVREHVRESLTPMFDKYNSESSRLYDEVELIESFNEWSRYTAMNTIGRLLVQSGALYTGVEEEKLAFSIDIGECSVTVYDDDAEGNGSCELIHRYYLISEATKSANGEMRAPPLPSKDFVWEFERQFITCPEHVAQRVAFQTLEEGFECPRTLRSHQDQALSMKKRYSKIWNHLQITSIGRASHLFSIAPALKNDLTEHFPDISVDELEQALHVCSSGCFVCNGASRSSAFPLSVSERYTSRGVLDGLVNFGEECEGYLNGRDRHQYGVVGRGRTEVYPHWHANNEQEYVIPFTILPRQIGTFVKRSQLNVELRPIRLVRLVDHLEASL
jgi:hypothetical protein